MSELTKKIDNTPFTDLDQGADFLKISSEHCRLCGICQKTCIREAVDLENFKIDLDRCLGCYHCYAACPFGAITYEQGKATPAKDHNILPEQFENLIYFRRSMRNFLSKEVPEEIIQKIADLVRYTPTATHNQGVHLTIITNKEHIKNLNDQVMAYYDQLTSKINPLTKWIFYLFLGKTITNKVAGFKDALKRYREGKNVVTHDAPLLFIVHAPAKGTMPADDCNIGATIAMLYGESQGLGSCRIGYITNALKRNKKLKRQLSIPDEHQVYATFTLGYPSVKYQRKAFRKKNRVTRIN